VVPAVGAPAKVLLVLVRRMGWASPARGWVGEHNRTVDKRHRWVNWYIRNLDTDRVQTVEEQSGVGVSQARDRPAQGVGDSGCRTWLWNDFAHRNLRR